MDNYSRLIYVYIVLEHQRAAWAAGYMLDGLGCCSSELAAAWGLCEKGLLPLNSLTEVGFWGSQEANLWKRKGPYIQDSVILDSDFAKLRNEEQYGKEWE